VPTSTTDSTLRQELVNLERELIDRAPELALFLAYDRPQRAAERPALERAFFAQRCISDAQIAQTIDAFRSVGSYVELFEGELPLMEALANGRLQSVDRDLKVIYNGIEGGITPGGFEPGRKALVPTLADAYGVICSNSNAYACALGRHKFHYFTVLRALGVLAPEVWHYRYPDGWVQGRAPAAGTKVIVKSTYESWAVGVTEDSVFLVDGDSEQKVAAISEEIGQPVTVQEFVSGTEVCVPVFGPPDPIVTPPVEIILARAPGDVDSFMTIDDNLTQGEIGYRRFDRGPEVDRQLAAAAIAAFEILELGAFARIDFRVDEEDRAWVIDVGVAPGMARHSSATYSLAQLGFDHPSFLRVVVAATLASRGALS
jgi:D-alanine-D-alanine ligase and related ATP-grasp enzymes